MSRFTGARTFHRSRASTEVAIKGLEPLRSAFERKKKKSAADQDSKKGRKELDRRHKNRDKYMEVLNTGWLGKRFLKHNKTRPDKEAGI